MPKPIQPAPPVDEYRFDVFISYRQQDPDMSWVRKILVPRLRAAGLRICIDFECFRLGAPLITEMTRAVEQSRYTLAVLSPKYLASNFTELEAILAEHPGLEKGQRRLLALLRAECQPRLDMRARLWLDMTDDAQFEAALTRLIGELQQSLDD